MPADSLHCMNWLRSRVLQLWLHWSVDIYRHCVLFALFIFVGVLTWLLHVAWTHILIVVMMHCLVVMVILEMHYICFNFASSLLYAFVLYLRFTLTLLCSSSLYSSVLYPVHLLCFVLLPLTHFLRVLFLCNFSPAPVFIPAVKYSSTWKCMISWLQSSQQLQ